MTLKVKVNQSRFQDTCLVQIKLFQLKYVLLIEISI